MHTNNVVMELCMYILYAYVLPYVFIIMHWNAWSLDIEFESVKIHVLCKAFNMPYKFVCNHNMCCIRVFQALPCIDSNKERK